MLKLHSQDEIGTVPSFPQAPPQWITILILISQKILLNIKDVEFDFRMGCILFLFPFLWIINVQFTNFGFFIFYFFILKFSDIGLFWSKITIFIIEIYLKLHLHTKYGWNNPNSCRLDLKCKKFHFLPFPAAQKIITYTNIQIHVTCSIFIVNWFF